jgi:sulfhydrogenase subunit beta (sulfur reductase)
MYKCVPKSQMPDLMQTWMKQAEIFTPVHREHLIAFEPLDNPANADLTAADNVTYPPKSLFLPQSETLLRWDRGQLQEDKPDSAARVIVGMKPCDARALTLLDKVFLGGACMDPYWQRRREATTVVGLACSRPCPTCFCMGVGSGPFDPVGVDALLIDMHGEYLVRITSDKGRRLFDTSAEAPDDWIARADAARQEAEARIAVPVTPREIGDRLNSLFASDFWLEVEQTCIGCGVCTFLCPTCHCFDIVDETALGQRVRNWDTCMFRQYSQEASGHNPRPSKLERTRNRIMHKYAYFPSRHQEIACTGCGRCVRHCPVNIDIRQIIQSALAYRSQ